MKKKFYLPLILSAAIPAVTCIAESPAARKNEEPRGRMSDRVTHGAGTTIARAASIYSAILKGPHGQIPASVLKKADCVAVFSNVISAAAVVGASGGEGIASCKTANGSWSNPIFLNLAGGSIGAQIGAKSTDIVLVGTNTRLREALQNKPSFDLGGDLNVVAGNFDEQMSIPAEGLIAYQQAQGAFAGIALNGVTISRNDTEQRQFYGRDTDSASILKGSANAASGMSAREFTSLLPS